MIESRLTSEQIGYYFTGFYRALKRYRQQTIAGWIVTAIGGGGLLLGWEVGRAEDLLDLIVALVTVAAGIGLVQSSIATLEAYVRIPFPKGNESSDDATVSNPKEEIIELMNDIDRGGWQDAFAAIKKLEAMQQQSDLPSLS